jgi:hypothetical protein
LVVYHNKFADTRGWIKSSAAYVDKSSGITLQKSLADGLGLPRVGYVIFKDYVTQLEYIRSCKEIWDKGMYVELSAYQCHAFMDWRFVGDSEWKTICDQLNGAGVPSMQDEWKKLFSLVEEVNVEEKVPAKKKRATRKVAVKAKSVKNSSKKKSVVTKTKTTAKKTVVKKAPSTTKKKPVVKKVVVKKPASKAKPVVKKSSVKKSVAPKKVTTKKTVTKRTLNKRP